MSKVSVIVPCYNQERYISECLDSILAQTFVDYEVIVINDGSTDDSLKVINKYAEAYSFVKIINQKNQGIVVTRNKGIEQASGKYILPVDGDDKIAPTYLEKAVNVLESNAKVRVVYCEAEFFGARQGKWELRKYSFPEILSDNCVFSCALFYKEDWKKVGGYNESMKCGLEDFEFWLSLIEKLNVQFYQIPEVLFYYRQQENSLSKNFKDNEIFVALWNTIFDLHKDMYIKYRRRLLGCCRRRLDRHFPPFFYRERTQKENIYHLGKFQLKIRRKHA